MFSQSVREIAAIAQAAGRLLHEQRAQGPPTEFVKEGGSLVTAADYASQLLLVRELYPLLKPMPFLMEEDEPQLLAEVRGLCPGISLISPSRQTEETLELPADYVSIDPADGTYLYAGQCPEYAVSIAVVRDYQPAWGVIYHPEFEQLVLAERGRGCQVNGAAPKLVADAPLAESLVGLDICRSAGETNNQRSLRIGQACRYVRNLPSVASGVELLLGRTAAWFTGNTRNWDIAASSLAVQEAGGSAETYAGQPLPWNRVRMPAVLFSANATLAAEVRTAGK